MRFEFDWMRAGDEEDEFTLGRKIYGVVTGTVVPSPPDPQGLGRVRVQIPMIDSLDPSPWARVASPSAGLFHGNYFIPNPGDAVLIAFENGDISVPYIVGALWHNVSRPPVPMSELQIRALRTLAGNQIVFEETPPTVTIQNGPTAPAPIPTPASPVAPYQTVKLSPLGVEVTGNTLTLQGGMITLQSGDNSIQLNPAGILLKSGGNLIAIGKDGITVLGSKVQVLGGDVRINS